MTMSLTFDAVSEDRVGPKWKARWDRSWPAYQAWFTARGGDNGPDRDACEAALAQHMPELVDLHRDLSKLVGNSDRAARFLSAWCPPAYLGGCSLAAAADESGVRLVRNYDLSPDLNEGLLLRSVWTGKPVMGMVEFLWGLSDGINADGLSVALAYGGGSETGEGFGICLILRYVLETCATVPEAIAVLRRVPSHMGYNIVLADRAGRTASIEMRAGGGTLMRPLAVATNHQHSGQAPDRPSFTRTKERYSHLEAILVEAPKPSGLAPRFLEKPLFQDGYAAGFGTLFTAEYDPDTPRVTLHWPDGNWVQDLDNFNEGQRIVTYDRTAPETGEWIADLEPWLGGQTAHFSDLAKVTDWAAWGRDIGKYWSTQH